MSHLYVGKKIVTAWPATNTTQDPVRAGEMLEGYGVMYEDGYNSWCPKDVFEAAYVQIGNTEGFAPHEIRVAGEYADLRDAHEKLAVFFDSDIFKSLSDENRGLLENQHAVQALLLDLLEMRLNHFAATAIQAGRRSEGNHIPFGASRVRAFEPQLGQSYADAVSAARLNAGLRATNDEALERHHVAYDKLVKEQFPETKLDLLEVKPDRRALTIQLDPNDPNPGATLAEYIEHARKQNPEYQLGNIEIALDKV